MACPTPKICFWNGRRYDWTGATAQQLELRDRDTERKMKRSHDKVDSYADGGAVKRSLYEVFIRSAVASGNVADVHRYLKQGVDPNAMYTHGRGDEPFVVTASKLANAQMLQLLLDHGARVDEPMGGDTALLHASSAGHTECVKLLLAAGSSVHGSVWTKTGVTPLHRACAGGHAHCVRLLVDAGAAVNMPSAAGEYPLQNAAMLCHADVIKILLAAGADRDTAGVGGRTSTLQGVELKKDEECVELLRGSNERQGGGGSRIAEAVM
jgi:ankyrin repeat protein